MELPNEGLSLSPIQAKVVVQKNVPFNKQGSFFSIEHQNIRNFVSTFPCFRFFGGSACKTALMKRPKGSWFAMHKTLSVIAAGLVAYFRYQIRIQNVFVIGAGSYRTRCWVSEQGDRIAESLFTAPLPNLPNDSLFTCSAVTRLLATVQSAFCHPD